MKDAEAILFDLDGTLTNSGRGIMEAYAYVATQMCVEQPLLEVLRTFIGPPVRGNLAQFLPVDKIEEGVTHYFHYLVDMRKGITENAVYVGISDALSRLEEKKKKLYVATAKRADFAVEIITHFGLQSFFRNIYGAQSDGNGADKGDIIAKILAEQDLNPATTVMVGDRLHDIVGAKKNGIRSIGVTWGYGLEQELLDTGADAIVHEPQELVELLMRA